jgi:hypothetical protein
LRIRLRILDIPDTANPNGEIAPRNLCALKRIGQTIEHVSIWAVGDGENALLTPQQNAPARRFSISFRALGSPHVSITRAFVDDVRV